MILKQCSKIQVLQSSKIYKAGSIGFVAFQQRSFNWWNTWEMVTMFIRFGKSGKPRLTPELIEVPIISYGKKGDEIYEIINNNKSNWIRIQKISTKIEEVPFESKILVHWNNLEFVAYVAAFAALSYIFKTMANPGRLSKNAHSLLSFILRPNRRFETDETVFHEDTRIPFERVPVAFYPTLVTRLSRRWPDVFAKACENLTVQDKKQVLMAIQKDFVVSKEIVREWNSKLKQDLKTANSHVNVFVKGGEFIVEKELPSKPNTL